MGLLIIWLGVIYFFSSQNGIDSSNLSSGLLKELGLLLNVQDIDLLMVKYAFLFRKLAHFAEYFVLGILIYINLREYSKQKVYPIAIVLCILYALTDEIHQLFVAGRAFAITDILIDSFGSSIGVFVTHLIYEKCFHVKKQ